MAAYPPGRGGLNATLHRVQALRRGEPERPDRARQHGDDLEGDAAAPCSRVAQLARHQGAHRVRNVVLKTLQPRDVDPDRGPWRKRGEGARRDANVPGRRGCS